MKNRFAVSSVVLGVLGALAVTSASAQSTVNLGGRVDGGIQYADDGVNKVKQQSSGVYTASRLNFKGTEDMGGGLKAVFFMEHRFNEDTGAQQNAGKFWNAEVYAGLEGSFGRVTLGRQYTPTFWPFLFGDDTGPLRLHGYSALQSVQRSNYARIAGAAAPQINTLSSGAIATVAGAGAAKTVSLGIASAFEDNMVIYKTPNMSGFTAMIGVGAGEGQAGSAGARNVGGNVEYRNSAFYIGAGVNNKQGAGTGGTEKVREGVISGMWYTTKDFHLWGNVHNWRFSSGVNTELKGHDWMLGASYWMPQGELWANYARKTISNCTNCNSNGFGVGYQHFLSKRTELYVAYGNVRNELNSANTLNGIAPAAFGKDPKGFGAGIAHQF